MNQNQCIVVATLHRHSTTAATTNRTSIFNDSVTSTLGAASYQLATTPTSYSDTYTGTASQNWAMVAAAFKPAASAGAILVKAPWAIELGCTMHGLFASVEAIALLSIKTTHVHHNI